MWRLLVYRFSRFRTPRSASALRQIRLHVSYIRDRPPGSRAKPIAVSYTIGSLVKKWFKENDVNEDFTASSSGKRQKFQKVVFIIA